MNINSLQFNKEIEVSIKRQMELTKNKQMTEEEYRYIASHLGSKNVLVFGTGHDSDLWRLANNNGKTIFLEHNKKWIKQNDDDVYKVNYGTKLKEADRLLDKYRSTKDFEMLKLELPEFVWNINWDIIVVDAPTGVKDGHPGRMKSIFTASLLSKKDTDVFVHDCDRRVEDLYTREFFGNSFRQLTKLRHFKQ